MKRCPFCAEEIQAAAIVCRFCNRDLPAAPPVPVVAQPEVETPGPSILKVLVWSLVIVGAVAVVVVNLAMGANAEPDAPEAPILNVSGGRGVGGFELTNRESVPITSCHVEVLDQGSDSWRAFVYEPIKPYDTARIRWDLFRLGEGKMPSYVGLNRDHFIIGCMVGSERRSAGLSF